MVTELQKRCIEEASHEKLKNDAYAMLMNEEYYQSEIKRLEEENKKLRKTIKDHQLYEEKLEHRIIEFEELLHGE